MLTKHTNEYGVITYDEGLVYQLLAEAIKPWEGKVRYSGDKELRFDEEGLYLYAPLSIKIGCSISEICSGIMNYVADGIENSLQLPISDIVLEVVQMTTSRKSVKRDIKVSYRGGETEEEQQ